MHPEKLSLSAEALMRSPGWDAVTSGVGEFTHRPSWNTKAIWGFETSQEDWIAMQMVRLLVTQSVMYRRRACIAAGMWDESLELWQDWEYNFRLTLSGARWGQIDRVLTLNRVHRFGRITDFNTRTVWSALAAMKKVRAMLRPEDWADKRVRAAYVFSLLDIAVMGIIAGNLHVLRESAAHGRPIAGRWDRRMFNALGALARLPNRIGAPAAAALLRIRRTLL